MSRLPYLRYQDLDDAGRRCWDAVTASRGTQLVNEQGGLIGPFNSFVHSPDLGRRMSALGATVRFGTSVERRLSELAIITTGARWRAEFEWHAHSRMAIEHGVPQAVVDAIGRGEDPPFAAADERAVYEVARQLSAGGHLDQAAYDAAHALLGDAGMVELVATVGYYSLISFLLNAFDVPLPDGVAPAWGTAT